MPKFYTVATNNAFAALDEQEDGDDLILTQSPERISQLAAEKEKPTATPSAAPQKEGKPSASEKKPRAPRSQKPATEGRVRRVPSSDAQEPTEATDNYKQPRVQRERKVRPEGRLDRHSGTGHGREMKKQGAGAFNWGQAGDEVNAEIPVEKDATEEGAAPATEIAAAKPENSVQTFADYKAEQEKTKAEGLEERQPTKSDNTATLGAGVRVYTKAVGEESAVKSAGAAGERTKAGSSSPVVNLRYNAPRRGDDRRVERTERTERSAEGKRDRSGHKSTDLKLDDNKAFPTLAH